MENSKLKEIMSYKELIKVFSSEDISIINKIIETNFNKESLYSSDKSEIKISNNSLVYEDCLLRGNIFIGNNSTIGRNVKIIGDVTILDNVKISDNCLIRGKTCISSFSKLAKDVEVKDSIISNNSMIGPSSFIGSSIVGSNCFLGAMVRTSNVRLDNKNIKLRIDDWSLEIGNDFGCLIGTNVKIGLLTSILPGRYLPKNFILKPNSCFSSLNNL